MSSELPIPLRYRCPKRWAELDGDGASRHCSSCDLDVHDLSALTRERALELLAKPGPRLCVTYVIGADGRVRHAKPPARLERWRGNLARLGAALTLGLPFFAACEQPSTTPRATDADTHDAPDESGASKPGANETPCQPDTKDEAGEELRVMGYF